MEGRIGHGGDSAAKVAEANCRGVGNEGGANNARGAPRAFGVAWDLFKGLIEELRRLQWSLLTIGFAVDKIIE